MRTSTLAFVFAAVLSACAGGGDDPPPTPDANSNPNAPICGDGTCAAAEVNVCSQDCGSTATPVCGNGQCEAGEAAACPGDCGGAPVCGDSTCDMAGGENATNCPGDCSGGGGGGALDCQAPDTLLGCFGCILDPTTCAAPFTEADCNACFGGV